MENKTPEEIKRSMCYLEDGRFKGTDVINEVIEYVRLENQSQLKEIREKIENTSGSLNDVLDILDSYINEK